MVSVFIHLIAVDLKLASSAYIVASVPHSPRWWDDISSYIGTRTSFVVPRGNGVARTSVLLSGEVQRWSDGLGGYDRGSRSTHIQLLTELVRT